MSLIVEGTPVIQANQTAPCATAATNPNTAGHNQPYYKPIASKKDTTFNMKVVKAKMSKLHNGRSLKNLDTSALMTALLMSTL